MAKKKVAHQPEHPKTEKPQHQEPPPPMEDPKKKVQNLKSLNSMLLKETIERRQQVESLVQAKQALESELERFNLERVGLEGELTRVADDRACLEIEKLLLYVFMETQVGEMGREKRERDLEVGLLKKEVGGLRLGLEGERVRLGQVLRERDLLKSDLANWEKEAGGLRAKVGELERKEKGSQEEIRKLKVRYVGLVKQKEDTEEEIAEIRKVRDLVEKSLVERVDEFERLSRVVVGIEREKKLVEVERDEQRMKIGELENESRGLNEVVLSLRKEEQVLREKVLELEKSFGEAIGKEKVMEEEIGALVKDKREKEREIERLMVEKLSISELFQLVCLEKKNKEEEIERLLIEKEEMEEDKACKESEIVGLRSEMNKLRSDVFVLQESLEHQEGKNRELVSEMNLFKASYEQVQLERDSLEKSLGKEREDLMNLTSKVQELEKGIEKTAKVLVKMQSENKNLIKEKKEMEGHIVQLKKEKYAAEMGLSDVQCEVGELRTKNESVSVVSQRALAMLKEIAASMRKSCNGKGELIVNEKNLTAEIDPYAIELEAIKNAIKQKEDVVKEMKQQVEFLQNSVDDANRKKGFLTILSSATTVFAAIFLAYATRMR